MTLMLEKLKPSMGRQRTGTIMPRRHSSLAAQLQHDRQGGSPLFSVLTFESISSV